MGMTSVGSRFFAEKVSLVRFTKLIQTGKAETGKILGEETKIRFVPVVFLDLHLPVWKNIFWTCRFSVIKNDKKTTENTYFRLSVHNTGILVRVPMPFVRYAYSWLAIREALYLRIIRLWTFTTISTDWLNQPSRKYGRAFGAGCSLLKLQTNETSVLII